MMKWYPQFYVYTSSIQTYIQISCSRSPASSDSLLVRSRDFWRGTTELRPIRGREFDFRFDGVLLGILGLKECVLCKLEVLHGEDDGDLRVE